MAAFRQQSFAAGELGPMLHGRTDLDRYGQGLKRLYNFFIARQGPVLTRPGTEYLGVAGAAQVKLVPFLWSDTDTVSNAVLEFSAGLMQVWSGGAVVATVSGLPYATADLPKLRWTQSGDVLTLACAGYPPATVTRSGPTSWAYAAIDFSRPTPNCTPMLDESTVNVPDDSHPRKQRAYLVTEIRKDARSTVYESAPVKVTQEFFTYGSAWNSLTTFKVNTVVLSGGSYWKALSQNIGVVPGTDGGAIWQVTTAPVAPIPEQIDSYSGSTVCYPDKHRGMRLTTTNSADDPNFITFRIYGGAAGVYGWLGDSSADTWVDEGNDPDFDWGPPQGTNPFEVHDDSGTLLRTETPIAVTYFEDRLTFGGTTDVVANGSTIERPAFLFLSAVGDYDNFDQRLVAVADESLLFALSARRREVMRSIVGVKKKLFALTNSSLWVVAGADGPIAPDSVDASPDVDTGADWPVPLVIDDAILWVRNKGTGVHAAGFDLQRGGYQGTDLSEVAQHFFLGHQIVDWCHLEDPWGIVVAVREDGIPLCLTYAPSEGVWGWSQIPVLSPDTGANGVVQSVCSIPEGNEDVVYLAMNGPVGQHARILRFTTRIESDTTTPVPLDSFVDGTVAAAGGNTTVSGLAHLNGRTVRAIADGVLQADSYVVGGGQIVIAGTFAQVYVGMPFTAELELLPLAESRDKQKVVTRVGLEVMAQGTLQAGADLANLFDFVIGSDDGLDVAKLPVAGNWDSLGRAALRVTEPISVTLRGVTREVAGGQQ